MSAASVTIRSRCSAPTRPRHDQTGIRPRAKAATARSISPASRTLSGSPPARARAPRLDYAELADPGGYGGIPNDRCALHARCDLLEQLQPFPAHAVFETDETGDVAARPRQAVDKAGPDRIGDVREHDRHGAGRLQQGVPAPLPAARMTSGASATNSAAYLRVSSALPAAQRYSICRLRPTVQPDCCSPCRNAAMRACATATVRRECHQDADAPHRARAAAHAPQAATPPPRHQAA